MVTLAPASWTLSTGRLDQDLAKSWVDPAAQVWRHDENKWKKLFHVAGVFLGSYEYYSHENYVLVLM